MRHEANNQQVDRKAKKVVLQREEQAEVSIAGWKDKMGRWKGGLPGFMGTFQVLLWVLKLLRTYPLPFPSF